MGEVRRLRVGGTAARWRRRAAVRQPTTRREPRRRAGRRTRAPAPRRPGRARRRTWSGRRSRVPVARNEPAYTNGGDRRLPVDDVAVQRAAALEHHAHRRDRAPRPSRTAGARNPGRWTTNAPTTIAAAPSAVLVASGWRRRPAVSSAVIVAARGFGSWDSSLRRRRLAVVRWIVALVGIGLTVFCLVRLVEVDNRAAQASPWWYLGLIGMALTLLALGSPWSARTAADDRRADAAGAPDPAPRARA